LINNEIEIYRSITREDIQAVAKKYLNPNQRLVLEYLPETKVE
jgi:predicted Zn-dependent peptidase